MNQPQAGFSFADFDAETYITRRLGEHGTHVFTGFSSHDDRKLRIREAILAAGLEYVIIGRNGAGKPETYAQVFERHFGEPLQQKTKGKSHVQTSL